MENKQTKPWYKKLWVWGGIIFVLAMIGNFADNEETEVVADTTIEEQVEIEDEVELKDDNETEDREIEPKADEVEEETNNVEQENEQNEKFESALKNWEEDQRDWWINEYAEYGVVDIQPVTDSFSHVNVVVTDELKVLSDNEKEYLVDLVGSRANNFVSVHFGHFSESVGVAQPKDVYVDFYYTDGKLLARQKVMSQGWDIK